MKKLIFTFLCLASQFLVRAQLLYGVAFGDNVNNSGFLYSYDVGTKTYTKLKVFGVGSDEEGQPHDLVQAANGKLYGFAQVQFRTVIFSFDPGTNIYTKLKTFSADGKEGSYSAGFVQAANGKFYGVTDMGGSKNMGVLYSFDPATNTYAKLRDFDRNTGEGAYPAVSLLPATDGKLYGITYHDYEFFDEDPVPLSTQKKNTVIFSFDPATNIYTKLKELSGIGDNYTTAPRTTLVQAADGKLYGVGKGYNEEFIYSFDPSTEAFTKLKNLSRKDGDHVAGTLLQAKNGQIYGTSSAGGSANYGVIFSYAPATNSYARLKDFTAGEDGRTPGYSLSQTSNGKLYGTISDGGGKPISSIFSFDPVTKTYSKLKEYSRSEGIVFEPPIELPCNAITYYRDKDGDGYGDAAATECAFAQPTGYVTNGADCNDENVSVHPGAEEICNGIDDDCDGLVDEGCAVSITGFTLVNASTDKDLQTLNEGDVLDLSTLPRALLNIRANTTSAKIGSLVLELSGSEKHKQTENGRPYGLFLNTNGNYEGRPLQPGDYTLTATPYSNTNGTGTKGVPRVIHFKVIYPAAVTCFTVVKAQSGELFYLSVRDSLELDLAFVPVGNFSILAKTFPDTVGSVVFDLQGHQVHHATENHLPYALFGDNKKTYAPWVAEPGTYVLTATPYSAANGKGTKGPSQTIRLRVVNTSRSLSTIRSKSPTLILNNPKSLPILAASPNPFTLQSAVRFSVPKSGQTVLGLYNMTGVEVARLYSGNAERGEVYQATLDSKQLPPGVYLIRLASEGYSASTKVMLQR